MSVSNSNNVAEIESFSKWILDARDGQISEPNDGYANITIPSEFLLTDFVDPIESIVTSTYSNLIQNFTSPEFLQNRAILASTIEVVDEIKNFLISVVFPTPYLKFFNSTCVIYFNCVTTTFSH